MLYDFSPAVPFLVAIALVVAVGGLITLAALSRTVVGHHRIRVARHQSIPTYYRSVLAH